MEPRWIDAHCHLADPRLDADRDAVIARARANGIGRFIQGGVGPDDWMRQRALNERYPGTMHLCFGLHPWWIDAQTPEAARAGLEQLRSGLDGAIGLGELGLDFGPRTRPESRAVQLELFEAQLRLANERDLPLVLHIVHAHAEALEILKKTGIPRAGGLVHAFTGSRPVARQYAELGFTISVGGPVARKGFERLKQAVVSLPASQLVIETDSPDQPPPGFQGRLNEPSSLLEVAEAVAKLRGTPVEAVLEASRENLIRIFRLK